MDLPPQERSREGRWVKAINALNLDVWPSIHSKSSQSSGALSATSANLPGSAQLPFSNNEVAIENTLTRGDFQEPEKSPGRSPSQAWCSSSSDEAEDAEFELKGLSPRPTTGDEQLKKYWQLVKEQRWAEAKLACELGIVFDSNVQKPIELGEARYDALVLRNHPLLSVMGESNLSAAITFQPARNLFHHALCQRLAGNNKQINSVLSLWLATQAHVAAREYINLLSQEIRETALQQGLAQQTDNQESIINEIGCAAWRILVSVEWKKYVDDVSKKVIASVNVHVCEVDDAVLSNRPPAKGPSSKRHAKSSSRATSFPDSFFIMDENDYVELTSPGPSLSPSASLVSEKWWEYLAIDVSAALEFKMLAKCHSGGGPISRIVRFGKLEPHIANQESQEQAGSYYLLTIYPLVLRNGSQVVRKHMGALLNVTTLVRFSVVDRILGAVEDAVDTEQVQCQDAAVTRIQSSAKGVNSRAAFEKLRGLDGATRMEGGINTKQSNTFRGSSFYALYEVVSEGNAVFDQVSGQSGISSIYFSSP